MKDCFLKRDIKIFYCLYINKLWRYFNHFLIKHPFLLMNFLYMSSSLQLIMTNEDFDSNEGFYLDFYKYEKSKCIILNTLYKDKLVVEDFIEVHFFGL